MTLTVRAVDVGSGNTKFISAAAGVDVRCLSFPSIAYPSIDGRPGWAVGDRRRTILTPVGSLFYEVGPDVALAADTFRARQLHDDYTLSPEYMALLRGALAMMKLSQIDLLVVGLPVALFAGRKAALEAAMTGHHNIGNDKVVNVSRALAVAQPQGALVHYASVHGKLTEIGNERSLIIDPGSRTFDWLVAQGMRLVPKLRLPLKSGVRSPILKRQFLAAPPTSVVRIASG